MTDPQQPFFQHLDKFSDWVAEAARQQALFPLAEPGEATQARLRDVLGFYGGTEMPQDVQLERRWLHDGVQGEAISWSVGYGPRTQAWLLKPIEADEPLPGVVALHDHGGYKFIGKEKIARGPDEPPDYVRAVWEHYYGGHGWANALAREGFAVLVPDTFSWGSRQFPQSVMPPWAGQAYSVLNGIVDESETPPDIGAYNFAANQHEHILEKYCTLLGTTLAGVISHEDRIAVNYLRSRLDVDAERIGCAGLSGGGARAALLQATSDHVRAAVIVGMMSTYAPLLDKYVAGHTWMFFPTGWSKYGDYPDLAACRAPSPLLVQYLLDDHLFPVEGMRAADQRLAAHYARVGSPDHYEGAFYPGPHRFDVEMQRSAFAWLARQLK